MLFGICNLSIVPLRLEASNVSEMVNQVLFGEHFTIIKKGKNWSKIKLDFDNCEGYINNKQFTEIPEETFIKFSESENKYAGELVDFITDTNNHLTTIPLGAKLPEIENEYFSINDVRYNYQGSILKGKIAKEEIIQKAFLYLNTPFLWGGKTPFGIDCSGFTQMVYKLCGYTIYRDAKEQAKQGEVLSFIEESEPGDLAFFDDEEGNITHVGIIMHDYNIIHAYGKVRIDKLDHSGIYNVDTKKHTHKLRVIKKIV